MKYYEIYENDTDAKVHILEPTDGGYSIKYEITVGELVKLMSAIRLMRAKIEKQLGIEKE